MENVKNKDNYIFDEVTTKEILVIIKTINPKTAPEMDQITNNTLKNIAENQKI